MMSGRDGLVLREMGRLLAGGSVASLGTGQLLERFTADGDATAFEALVSRHGPMVLGTCRRMLADPHDIDDAFQATFLVLARKAGSIQDADRLGPWLHGVARRVASRSRALSARRKSVERPGGEEPSFETADTLEAFELRAVLDEELSRLPDKYRAPLVLCYLEGLTHDEAAQQLRWPVGTVRSRLAGGRDRLRVRLTRRGLAPAHAVSSFLPIAALPQALLSTTVRVATSAGSVPEHVATLAKGALVAMMWNKLKLVAALGLMAGLTVGGAGVSAQYGGNAPSGAAQSSRAEDEKRLAAMLKVAESFEASVSQTENHLKELRKNHDRVVLEIAALKKKLGTAQPPAPVEERKVVEQKVEEQKVEGPPLKAAPQFTPLIGSYAAVIPAEHDRVSIVNTETGKQATQRLPEGVTEVIPVYSGGVLALILKGPALRLIAAFNFHDGKWYPQDLKEPTTQASPIVGPQEATYQLGRYIYIFSTLAQKWSVLELKRAPANNGGGFPGMGGMQNGKMIVPEGDILHVYNGKTGEWTHVDTNAPDVEKVPDLTRVGSGAGSVARPRKGNPPVADTPAPQPTVRTLSGNPMLFAVISAERDRVTMINATTQQRETLRLPQAMTEIIPIDSGRLIGLLMKGPQVTRVGFYDRQAAKWFEHDLKEAATEVQPLINNGPSVGKSQTLIGLQLKGPEFTRLDVFDGRQNLWTTQDLREPAKGEVAPIVSMNTISYRLGRFLYSYSGIAKKWAVLELKREDAVLQGLDVGGGGLLSLDPTGRLIVPEGDMIHIYDPSTGDWTHIDTKDEK